MEICDRRKITTADTSQTRYSHKTLDYIYIYTLTDLADLADVNTNTSTSTTMITQVRVMKEP